MYNNVRYQALAALCLSAVLLATLLPNWFTCAGEPRAHPRALLLPVQPPSEYVWQPLSPGVNTSVQASLSSIHRRQSPQDEVFTKAQDRGKKLLCLLQSPHTAPQTHWTDFDDLETWGWVLEKHEGQDMVGAVLESVNQAMKDTGLSVKAPPNVNYVWVHNVQTEHERTTYPVGLIRNFLGGQSGYPCSG